MSIPNQIFIGTPWTMRAHYERFTERLEKFHPLHFVRMGSQKDRQYSDELFSLIKNSIRNSGAALFDVTKANPNVSLEYGFAEGVGVECYIFYCIHKRTQANVPGTAIISNLGGKRRIQYTNVNALESELKKFCKNHPFTTKFEVSLKKAFGRLGKGKKKFYRTLAIKLVHGLDDRDDIDRSVLIGRLSTNYRKADIELVIKKLHSVGIVNASVGGHSKVSIKEA